MRTSARQSSLSVGARWSRGAQARCAEREPGARTATRGCQWRIAKGASGGCEGATPGSHHPTYCAAEASDGKLCDLLNRGRVVTPAQYSKLFLMWKAAVGDGNTQSHPATQNKGIIP